MPFDSHWSMASRRDWQAGLVLTIVALLCIEQTAAFGELAPVDEEEMEAVERQRSSAKRSYQAVNGYASRPDELTLEKLEISWQPPELDALGDRCIIRGQMLLPATPMSDATAVNWFQGVSLCIARKPGAQPIWNGDECKRGTLLRPSILAKSGRFEFVIDLRHLEHQRHTALQFQFGMALAEHEGSYDTHTVQWSTKVKPIPATIRMLTIPAAPKLPRALELVNRTRGWPHSHQNTIHLINTVNVLQGLGKERALDVLAKFAALSDEFDDQFRAYDQETVTWIVHLLFEPIDSSQRVPARGNYLFPAGNNAAANLQWPHNPLEVVEDIPFNIGDNYRGCGGGCFEGVEYSHPSEPIAWAWEHGLIRQEPLCPRMHPLLAAETLIRSRRFQKLIQSDGSVDEQKIWQIRSQALEMLDGHPAANESDEEEDARISDKDWYARLNNASQQCLKWSVDEEKFVAIDN